MFTNFEIKKPAKNLNYYHFSPISSLKEKHAEELKLFEDFPEKDYDNENKKNEFIDKIKNFPIEIFINITINKLISKTGLNFLYEKKDNNDVSSNFFKFSLDIIGVIGFIGSNKLPEKSLKLLIKYFDKDVFRDKLIQKLDCEGFFISLYGLRYCLYSLKNENNKKNFYTSLFHYKEYKLPANKGQIPGCEPIKNKKKFINPSSTFKLFGKKFYFNLKIFKIIIFLIKIK